MMPLSAQRGHGAAAQKLPDAHPGFCRLAANWPHTLAIAGGKGWLYDEMLAEIERQKLNGRVRFIGFVDDADLPALYTGADFFFSQPV
jgi:glycosyltransferase involved in cell wall biosynthesis